MVKIVRSSAYQAPEESEDITDSGRIARILEQMSKHYSPLTVKIAGYKVLYTSCIVGVDRPYVLLDELMPSTGHDRLLIERQVLVTGKLDRVDIRFSTTLVRVDEQQDMLTYYMKLPEKLKYKQRRLAYRVRIPLSKQLTVMIDNGSDTLTIGELHDLSHGGIGNIIPIDGIEFEAGLTYECVIELPCGEWLFCTVEMCFNKSLPSRKKQFIGAMFINLSVVQRRLISRCISKLELEAIKKRSMY